MLILLKNQIFTQTRLWQFIADYRQNKLKTDSKPT